MNALAIAIALAAAGGVASAKPVPVTGPAPIEARAADGTRFQLRCPAGPATQPGRLVVIAPNVDQKIEHVEIAYRLGFAAAVVDPPREGQDYASRLQAVLDAVPSTKSPCALSGEIAAWGQGFGGKAVLELARRREASGTPLAAVVAFLVSETGAAIPSLATPVLIIDRAPTSHPRTLVLAGLGGCEVSLGGCTSRKPAVETSLGWRWSSIVSRSREFIEAFAGGDAAARSAIAAWDLAPRPELPKPPEVVKRPLAKLVNLSLITGWTSQGENGFVIGGRPEAFLAWDDRNQIGRGVGVYVEALGANDHLVVGAGAAYASYYGRIGLVPSIGYYHRTGAVMEPDRGISAGLFLGFRKPAVLDPEHDPIGLDLPYGLRIDTHFGFDGTRDVMITAQLDTAPIVGGLIALIALISDSDRMGRQQ